MKFSWKFYLDKMKRFEKNHDSYHICRGRNMLPFYCYEILSVTLILVKRGPGAFL